MNFYKHHIGDYDADTSHLTWLEDCAYSRLMRLYYRREQPIPADVAQACRLVRATSKDERAAVETVLHEFFELREEGWHQKRCDEEIARSSAQRDVNRETGKRGGRPPKTNRTETESVSEQEPNGNRIGYETGTETEPINNPSQTPDTRHQTKALRAVRATSPKKTGLPAGFCVSDRVRAWAAERGYARLDEHLEAFRNKAAANGYTYSDWDSAFMEAIRGDWAKLDGKPAPVVDGMPEWMRGAI